MNGPVCLQPEEQRVHFEPLTYLRQYYSNNDLSRGLKIILCFLPNIAARLPRLPRLLDVGSGPTVFMAIGLRNKVDEIHLSDFADQNRNELQNWLHGRASFDWSPICKAIAELEGVNRDDWQLLEDQARRKVRQILFCDVHQTHVLPQPGQQYDVISAIFCLEYASENWAQYRGAFANVCRLIAPGGWLILGGAFRENFYTLGDKRFRCHFLTEEELFTALRENGVLVDDSSFSFYCHEDAFVVVARMPD